MVKAPDGRGVSRRQFLKVTAGGITGAALLTTGASWGASRLAGGSSSHADVKDLGRSAFVQHLGDVFKIHNGPLDTIDVSLVNLADITTSQLDSPEWSFSAVFRGPRERLLGQNTYMVEHSGLGSFPLFIVPVYYDDDGLHYEAIFNRTRS